MHYALFYDYVQDYSERRGAFRDEHLVLARAAANPADGGMPLFSGSSPAVAENFAKADPYVTNGLVTGGGCENGRQLSGKMLPIP